MEKQKVTITELGFGVKIERREGKETIIHNLISNGQGAGYLGVRWKE